MKAKIHEIWILLKLTKNKDLTINFYLHKIFMCVCVKTNTSLNFCYWLFFLMLVISDEGMQGLLNPSGKTINQKVILNKIS